VSTNVTVFNTIFSHDFQEAEENASRENDVDEDDTEESKLTIDFEEEVVEEEVVEEANTTDEPLDNSNDFTVEDGRSLSQWLEDARAAGVIDLWEDGRLRPIVMPLETLQPFLSVAGFRELTRRVEENSAAALERLNTGFNSFVADRAALAALPTPQHLEICEVVILFCFSQLLKLICFSCAVTKGKEKEREERKRKKEKKKNLKLTEKGK